MSEEKKISGNPYAKFQSAPAPSLMNQAAYYESDSNTKKKSKCCPNPLGELARWVATTQYTFYDAMSIMTTLLAFSPKPAAWMAAPITPTALFGSAIPNYLFWGYSVSIVVKRMTDKCQRRNAQERAALIERESTVENPYPKWLSHTLFVTTSVFGTVDTWSLFTFYSRESLTAAFGLQEATPAIWAVSAGGCGTLAAVFYVFTAQKEIYTELYNKHDEVTVPAKIPARYVLAFAGPMNEAVFMNYLPLYLQLHRMSGTNWVAVPFAGFISGCKYVSAFSFRSEVLLRGTPLMKWIDKKIDLLSDRSRKAFLGMTGGVSVITGISQYTFAGEEIFNDVFIKAFKREMSPGAVLGTSIGMSVIATAADMGSEYAGVVNRFFPPPNRQAQRIELDEKHLPVQRMEEGRSGQMTL